MKVELEPGCYVVAVSGGVDSMVLLDVVRKLPQLKLIVAHFDHGIRNNSSQDRKLVQKVAKSHGLQFVYDEAHLGPKASEATARQARYDFLHAVRVTSNAQAILTAHHQDDMLETAIINIIRGTGRRGLSSLQNREYVWRPLLAYTKKQIREYATQHKLEWHEDPTNVDEKYLRNYVRHKLLNKLSISQQQQLLAHVDNARELNKEIDELLAVQLHLQPATHKLDRQWFVRLSHAVAREVMASWLRSRNIPFDKKLVQRLVVAAKTYAPGKRVSVTQAVDMVVSRQHLALQEVDR